MLEANTNYAPSSQDEEGAREALRHDLTLDMSQLPDALTATVSAERIGNANGTGDSTGPQRLALINELSSELYTLLRKYVHLVEGSEGGWSLSEQQGLDAIIKTLARAGWTITRSEHGELDGVAPGVQAAVVGQPSPNGAAGVQWSRESSPDTEPHAHRLAL